MESSKKDTILPFGHGLGVCVERQRNGFIFEPQVLLFHAEGTIGEEAGSLCPGQPLTPFGKDTMVVEKN